MTSILSSQNNSYSNALVKLLERAQASSSDQTSTTTGSTSTTASSSNSPSLASVLSSDDSTTGLSAQTMSAITSLLMDIQSQSAQSSSGSTGAQGSGQGASDLFSKLDSDSDGSVSQSEFVSGRPKGMSEADATTLFKSIDSKGTGSISEEQLSAQMQKNGPHGAGPMGPPPGAQDASDLFSKLDSDSDGSVSQSEFVSGRPKDMSEDDATTLFKSIDTQGTGSISQDQLTESLKQNGPAGTGGAAASDGTSSTSDVGALAGDLMKQLMQVIQSFNNGYVDSSAYAASAADTTTTG
jgi:Ca2+-binding EF-hand superfamily protein